MQFEDERYVEDFCSSPKEARELEEVASLLGSMPKAEPPPSFQASLKEKLMRQAADTAVDLAAHHSARKRGKFFRPPLTAAAAVLILVALTVIYKPGPIKPGPQSIFPPDSPPIISERQKTDLEKEPHFSEGRQIAEEQIAEEQILVKPPAEESGEENSEEAGTGPKGFTPEEVCEPPDSTGEEGVPSAPVTPEKESLLPEGPAFKAWENEKSFKLAGQFNLPPVYYNVAAEDNPLPAENVSNSWNPRKFTMAVEGEAGEVGSHAWAREILSNEGFMVKEGDYLQVDAQETQKGLFLEIFYRNGSAAEPTLILHYQQDKGVIAYYYEEKGEAAEPGFYPLLSPALAFKRVNDLQWYAPVKRMEFSFQEVVLTYHQFVLEENGTRKTLRLPAYCYLGMEISSNGGMVKTYLPAIKL